MRWADMDLLGHINNVTYVDYLQEARIAMLAAHAPARASEQLAEGVVVVRTDVQFRSPLAWRLEPVRVESWVSEVRAASFTMAYEIVDETPDGGRRVHLQASTVLTPFVFAEERPRRITPEEKAALEVLLEPGFERTAKVPGAPAAGPRHTLPIKVRWSDVDAYGHVNNVTYFEYFQEARIQYLLTLPRPDDGPWSQWVVAHTDVEYRRPILFRLESYDVTQWVAEVGGKSAVLLGEIRDGDEVLARSRVVMVAFDKETQRATEMNPRQRQRLLDEIG
jgi:acyl-CoA thioester hydrolase